jgi:hypothetical protein
VDGSVTNEIQDLSLTGQTLSLTSDATTVTLPIVNVTAGTGIGVSISSGNATISNAGVTSVGVTAPITSTGGTTPSIGLNYDYIYMGINASNQLYPKYNIATWNASDLRGKTIAPAASNPSNNQILKYSTTTGQWELATDLGGTGTVTSVGLATGTTGTDVNVSGSPVTGAGTITLNIPDASASNRGLITTGTHRCIHFFAACALPGTPMNFMAGE